MNKFFIMGRNYNFCILTDIVIQCYGVGLLRCIPVVLFINNIVITIKIMIIVLRRTLVMKTIFELSYE